jgi:hypothetical protein
MTANDITFIINIFFLPIWLVWELTTFWLRGKGVFGGPLPGRESLSVGTISMVMQHRAYQLTVLPLFWSGMMAHWWWNDFDGKGTGGASDIVLWYTPFNDLHPVLKFYRAPMVQTIVGFLAAYFLFAQTMVRGSGWRWW